MSMRVRGLEAGGSLRSQAQFRFMDSFVRNLGVSRIRCVCARLWLGELLSLGLGP